jgi:hypothetical protein
MALIACSECGNQVSDKASACPKCGNPIAALTPTPAPAPAPAPVAAVLGVGATTSFCKRCKLQTMHVRPPTSHVLHLLLSLVTLGLWIPMWILVAISNSSQLRCATCGRERGLFGS